MRLHTVSYFLGSAKVKSPRFPVTLGNRVTVFLELAEIQRKLNLTVSLIANVNCRFNLSAHSYEILCYKIFKILI